MVGQPQQARHGAQRQGLPGDAVHFGFKTVVVDLFELRHLAAGAGVDVGAGPDGLAVAVVKHDAFAHRTAGDGLNIRRREWAAASAWRIHWQASCQLVPRSNSIEPGTLSTLRCFHSAWPTAIWRP
jgi:hypothetical protein